jgi:hypothetical protein
MQKVVRGADGIDWTVRSRLEWRLPATSDEFEHDVSVGNAAAIVLLVLVLALGTILIMWTPTDVVVPLWLVLLVLMAILFFPTRWALRRPWTVVAVKEYQDDRGRTVQERWVGVVRGVFTVRQQFNRVVKNISMDSMPGIEGPLQPVA